MLKIPITPKTRKLADKAKQALLDLVAEVRASYEALGMDEDEAQALAWGAVQQSTDRLRRKHQGLILRVSAAEHQRWIDAPVGEARQIDGVYYRKRADGYVERLKGLQSGMVANRLRYELRSD